MSRLLARILRMVRLIATLNLMAFNPTLKLLTHHYLARHFTQLKSIQSIDFYQRNRRQSIQTISQFLDNIDKFVANHLRTTTRADQTEAIAREFSTNHLVAL